MDTRCIVNDVPQDAYTHKYWVVKVHGGGAFFVKYYDNGGAATSHAMMDVEDKSIVVYNDLNQ